MILIRAFVFIASVKYCKLASKRSYWTCNWMRCLVDVRLQIRFSHILDWCSPARLIFSWYMATNAPLPPLSRLVSKDNGIGWSICTILYAKDGSKLLHNRKKGIFCCRKRTMSSSVNPLFDPAFTYYPMISSCSLLCSAAASFI